MMALHFGENSEAAEEIRKELSQEVELLKRKLQIRQGDVSKECGVNASMLSQWMLGHYKGNIARINGLMEAWIIRRSGKPDMVRHIDGIIPPLEVPETKLIPSPTETPVELNNPVITFPVKISSKRPLEESSNKSNAFKNVKKIVTKESRLTHCRPLYKYPKASSKDCCLVPIRLDIDHQGMRLIDSFVWNIYEKDFTYDTFASVLIQDLDLSFNFQKAIAECIRKQVEGCKRYITHKQTTQESLHPIVINLRVKDTILRDRFEWDLNNEQNNPEMFARCLCNDLCLSPEFEAKISFSIRQQLKMFSKLICDGYGQQCTRLPPVDYVLRSSKEMKKWEPSLLYLTTQDVTMTLREDIRKAQSRSNLMLQNNRKPLPPVKTPKVSIDTKTKPPKQLNSYIMFCNAIRSQMNAENPNQNAKDIAVLMGKKWTETPIEERAPYRKQAEIENARRLAEWKQTQQNNHPI